MANYAFSCKIIGQVWPAKLRVFADGAASLEKQVNRLWPGVSERLMAKEFDEASGGPVANAVLSPPAWNV